MYKDLPKQRYPLFLSAFIAYGWILIDAWMCGLRIRGRLLRVWYGRQPSSLPQPLYQRVFW